MVVHHPGGSQRVLGLIEAGVKGRATLAVNGQDWVVKCCEEGNYFMGSTVFTDVATGFTRPRFLTRLLLLSRQQRSMLRLNF